MLTRKLVTPLMGHPQTGWSTPPQKDITKAYCICGKYAHQPRFDLKTYIMEYETTEQQ